MGRQRTSFSLWGTWNERLHMFNNADAHPPFKRSPDLLSSFRPIKMHLVKSDLRHLLRLRSGWIS
jgi:hypothetical protein